MVYPPLRGPLNLLHLLDESVERPQRLRFVVVRDRNARGAQPEDKMGEWPVQLLGPEREQFIPEPKCE